MAQMHSLNPISLAYEERRRGDELLQALQPPAWQGRADCVGLSCSRPWAWQLVFNMSRWVLLPMTVYIGITVIYQGYIGIMEKNMETTI